MRAVADLRIYINVSYPGYVHADPLPGNGLSAILADPFTGICNDAPNGCLDVIAQYP